MKIQFNTDKTISGDEKHQDYFIDMITDELNRFSSHISRIEVHLSDQNGKKEGLNDILCMLEARIEGKQPLAVTCQTDTAEKAVSGALNKLKAMLETVIGKSQSRL